LTNTIYSVSIEVSKSPDEVFQQLTGDVSKFWPEEIIGECAKLNDEFIFHTDDSHFSRNKVVEIIPEKKIVWLVIESNRKSDSYDWSGTKMIFELTPNSNGTSIKFTYDGVVIENEYNRLTMICDLIIKENLNNLLNK
jgi:hypothetical protein